MIHKEPDVDQLAKCGARSETLTRGLRTCPQRKTAAIDGLVTELFEHGCLLDVGWILNVRLRNAAWTKGWGQNRQGEMSKNFTAVATTTPCATDRHMGR